MYGNNPLHIKKTKHISTWSFVESVATVQLVYNSFWQIEL